MITIISIIIIYITVINAVLLLIFLFRKKYVPTLEQKEFEAASVIVAFKNEIENLPDLIQALVNQSVDKNLIEIILVDDYSTDGSFELAINLVNNQTNIKVVKNRYNSGKKNALRTGIEEAKNDILIFTDADCLPNKDWIKTILQHFDFETDVICGFSPFISTSTFVNKLCQYENFFTSILMSSFYNVGMPYMAFGRNFGYRKSLFNELGGFSKIENSLSGDDDLFFQLAIKSGAKAKLLYEPDTLVFSKCNYTFNEFFRRKSRHISASKFYSNDIKAALSVIYGGNILFNIFLIPSILSLDLSLVSFIFFNWSIKVLAISFFTREMKIKFPIHLIPLLDFIYFISLIAIGIRSRLKVVRWK